MPVHLRVLCPCGRTLRARQEQAGSLIRCWSCRNRLPVPYPRIGGALARGWLACLRATLANAIVGPMLVAALVATSMLLVPRVGIWLAAVALMAACGYLVVILRRRGLDAGVDDDQEPSERELEPCGLALGLLAGLGLALPLVVRYGGLLPSRGAVGWGWFVALALIGGIVTPMALMAATARDRWGFLGPRQALRGGIRHPMALILALAVLPMGLLLIEGTLVAATWLPGWFPTLTVDVLPPSARVADRTGHPQVERHEFEHAPAAAFVRIYGEGVWAGHPLIEAIPASLARGPATRISLEILGYDRTACYAVRIALGVLTTLMLLLLAALQAQGLGQIAALGARRNARPKEAMSQ
jgi:hypothetical protein